MPCKLTRKIGSVVALALLWTVAGQRSAEANTIVDLTSQDATATLTAFSGDVFVVTEIDPSSTGTGFIDSFLRIQQNGQERGYNTDAKKVLDDKAGNFTHSLLVSEMQVVSLSGVNYFEFILDINQNHNNLLSLNQLQIFGSASDPGANYSLTEASSSPNTFANLSLSGATLLFQMSSATPGFDYELKLDYSLNSGSGSGDYSFLIPSDQFASYTNIILFSQFGLPNGANFSNDGFEEWWATCIPGTVDTCTGTPPPPPPDNPGQEVVPEPASLTLLGLGLLGAAAARRRRGKK